MLTTEFLKEYNTANNANKLAKEAKYRLERLGLDVPKELTPFFDNYERLEQQAIDYIGSFLPQELLNKLAPSRITGAFITDISGRISFHAQITLHTETNNIHIKFDNEKKCCYSEIWMIDNQNVKDLLKEYNIEDNSKFDAWIKVLDS